MEFKHFEGLIAATFTPFDANGELKLEVVPAYAKHLKEGGIKGVFVCGSSGEGLLMGIDDRKAVAEAWIPFSEDQFRVIVHVGSTSSKIAKELAAHAESIGADAIGCMGPCCFQPNNTEMLTAFCAEVALGAPNTPFYYYHIPGVSGVNIKMDDFLCGAGKVIPNLAGIKYTCSNLMEMTECIDMENKRFDILHGHDELLVNGLLVGAKAAIGTSYNTIAPIVNRLIDSFKNNKIKEALEIQKTINKVIAVMLSSGGAIPVGKAMMKMSGIDCGRCLPPLATLSDVQEQQLREKLEAIGYFKLLS